MRSSRSATDRTARAADPLDPGPFGFAHRGLHGPGIVENSMAAFRAALALGAGIECDVRLSSDGVPMLFHDCGLARLASDPRDLSDCSAAELSRLVLAGSDETIPRLSDLLNLVAGRVPLLLELKGSGSRLVRAVARVVANYHGPIGVMAFDARVIARLRRIAPSVRRGLVVGGDAGPFARFAALGIARPHFVALDRRWLGSAWARRVRRRRPVYGWTIATAADRRRVERHADAAIWEGHGRP